MTLRPPPPPPSSATHSSSLLNNVISHLNNNIMRSYYSIARCLVAVLLTSDAASAFTALLPGVAIAEEGRLGGRRVVVVASSSRSSLDAPSSPSSSSESESESEPRSCDGRSSFLRTSFAAMVSLTTFAPAIAFAGDDASAADDLSMPPVEERKVSEVSRTMRPSERGHRTASRQSVFVCMHRREGPPRNLDYREFHRSYRNSLRCARPGMNYRGRGDIAIPPRISRLLEKASEAAGIAAAAEFLPFPPWSVPPSQQRHIMFVVVIPYRPLSRYRPRSSISSSAGFAQRRNTK